MVKASRVERNGIIVKVEDGTLQGLLKVRWEVARNYGRAREGFGRNQPLKVQVLQPVKSWPDCGRRDGRSAG